MNIDLPATISAVTLLVSFISPVVVSVINNRHSEKMERMKEHERIRMQAVSEYIRNTGAAISTIGDDVYARYQSSYGEIFLYTSSDLWNSIEQINLMINRIHHHDEYHLRDLAVPAFSSLCQALSSDLSRKEYPKRNRKAKRLPNPDR